MVGFDVKLPEVKLSEETQNFIRRILGPAAELGDFLSEKVRFYRWKSSLKTMQRAEQIAAKFGIQPKEVPLRILIPLIEKASLEDERSPLIERWAMLLAQSSSDSQAVEAAFVDILSRLDILFSCGLITRVQRTFEVPGGEAYVSYISPTPLGIRFVAACRGDKLNQAES